VDHYAVAGWWRRRAVSPLDGIELLRVGQRDSVRNKISALDLFQGFFVARMAE
jgi:hypothetical protein